MKKKMISLLLVLVMVLSLVPAVSAAEPYIDVQTVIEPEYEEVKKDGKWGYIDQEGTVVVDFLYDWAGLFAEGVALTGVKETLYYSGYTEDVYVLHLIDKAGNDQVLYDNSLDGWLDIPNGYEQTPLTLYLNWETGLPYEEDQAEMDSSWYANGGVVIANNRIYDLSGEQIIFDDFDLLPEPEDWTWDYSYYDYASATGPCVDGLIPMYAGVMGLGNGCQPAFLINTKGELVKVFEPVANYDTGTGIFQVYAPDDGLILAGSLMGTVPDNWGYCYTRYGIMDTNGNWIVEPQYINYYIRTSGDIFYDDRLPLCNEDEKWGVIDTKGNTVVPFEYDWIGIYSEGYAAAMKDGKCLYLDVNGKEIQIAGLDGNAANVSICSSFNSIGLAAVWNADTGEGYCITDTLVNGMFQAVKGSENLDSQIYFPGYEGEGVPDYVTSPTDMIAIEENGLYGFAKVTVKGRNPFVDVKDSDYFLDSVVWAVDEGITAGTSATTFGPEENCTRAQVVTFLWRAAGEPTPETTVNPFSDVKETDWFYNAVLWAVENNITVGIGGGKFGTEDTCTRAQVATFLYRAAGEPGHNVTENPFTDIVDEWSLDPILWAYENGITKGDGLPNTFKPNGKCIRGQIVTFLYRADQIN